jgi:uncharacterized protein (TIGR03032 family)
MQNALAPAEACPSRPAQAPTSQISCTRGLADWLTRQQLSLAFTSYQSGRLYLCGTDQGRVHFHERFFVRAMALWADQQRLLLSSLYQVWRFENVLRPGERGAQGEDRQYIPRFATTTGDLDIHEVAVMSDGRIVFVNTLYSCLATLSQVHSFRPLWKPKFISKLAAEDRCHLNGLAMANGRPAYVSVVCRSDIVNGWRDRRAEGGSIIDVNSGEVVTERLSMPHSPRLHDGRLWVLNSGTGHLGTVDLAAGRFEPHTFCPGFLRGLDFHNGHAVVTLSLPRHSFAGLALDDELKRRDAEPWCGVQIIDLRSGDVVHWIRIDGEIRELFDIRVLPGTLKPMSTGIVSEEIQTVITVESE